MNQDKVVTPFMDSLIFHTCQTNKLYYACLLTSKNQLEMKEN
jgi:hypothetical protein